MYHTKKIILCCFGLVLFNNAMQEVLPPLTQKEIGRRLNNLLFETLSKQRSDMVPTIIGLGADPNIRDLAVEQYPNIGRHEGQSPLEYLLSKGRDREALHALLKGGAHATTRLQSGDTPFVDSMNKEDLVTANILRQYDPTAHRSLGCFTDPFVRLCAAALVGDECTVNQLIEGEGAHLINQRFGKNESKDPKKQDKEKLYTPAMIAAAAGHLAVMRNLLEKGADINAENEDKSTALTIALDFGTFPVLSRGLEHEAEVSKREDVALFLISNGAKRSSCIINAARYGRSAALQKIVEKDPQEINESDNKRPLVQAARNGQKHCVELLLAAGANIHEEEDGNEAWYVAVQNGHLNVARLLLQCDGNSRNTDMSNPLNKMLFRELGNYNPDLIQSLVSLGADPNVRNNDGKSPLELILSMSVFAINHPKVVHALLQAGACASTPLQSGDTPFVDSIKKERLHLANLFRNYDPTAPRSLEQLTDPFKKLCAAALVGDESLFSQMMDGEGIHFINSSFGEEHYTLLMIAAAGGHLPIVSNLLAKGANINARSWYYRATALSMALDFKTFPIFSQGSEYEREASKRDEVALFLIENIDLSKIYYALDAARYGRIKVLRELCQWRQSSFFAIPEIPLVKAVEHNHTECVKWLLIANKNMLHHKEYDNCSAFAHVMKTRNIGMGRLLLKHGADPYSARVHFGSYNFD